MMTRLSQELAAAEYPCHVVCKGDSMRVEAVGREHAPDGSLAPVHHRWWRGLDVLRVSVPLGSGQAAVGPSLTRWPGDLATASREVAESYVELAFSIWRGRAVLLIGESSGVERRDVDPERELLEPLGYEEGRDSNRGCVDWVGRGYEGCEWTVVAGWKGYVA
jgi:hypothetical protein